jgi:two-component system, NarL family, sensor kinase
VVIALAIGVVVLAALCAYLGIALARSRARQADLEALVGSVLDADEEIRRQTAQLLHDEALQSLLAANQELMEAAPGRVGVTRAHEVVSRTIVDLREAVGSLHPVTLAAGGLEAALSAVGRRAARQGGFEYAQTVDPDAVGQQDELVLAVARELLTNAAKHANASHVSVAVDRRGPDVVLEVADDGVGIDAGRRERALRHGHIGLASAAYRAEKAGGSLVLEGGPAGRGTRALTRVPAP